MSEFYIYHQYSGIFPSSSIKETYEDTYVSNMQTSMMSEEKYLDTLGVYVIILQTHISLNLR